MIFDFGSEIYIWAGRAADRTGFQKALAYAKELVSLIFFRADVIDTFIALFIIQLSFTLSVHSSYSSNSLHHIYQIVNFFLETTLAKNDPIGVFF